MAGLIIKLLPLLALILVFSKADNTELKHFVAISTHYQSCKCYYNIAFQYCLHVEHMYVDHDSFEELDSINTTSFLHCLAQFETMRDGSQEDWRIALKFDKMTKVCQRGKVPFQLVRVVRGMTHFIDNGSSVKLFIETELMKG